MAKASGTLAQALNLRRGEKRPLAVMGGFLLLATATTTVLSASKNGLFLSVYPGELIPHAVIAAALLTAFVSIVFAGVIGRAARRSLAVWLHLLLVASLFGSRAIFGAAPESSFGLYLWLSTVQVLVLTHAWDYVGDLLTGRQAKRLLPLIGIGASIGALLGGGSVAPLALILGTPNLLLVASGLLVASLPLLWLVPEPGRGDDAEEVGSAGSAVSFFTGASRGFRAIVSRPLLSAMGGTVVFLSLTSTLIELQYKLALQAAYSEDEITAVYGIMTSFVGAGTLVLQLVASRHIFPKLGVSFASKLHAGVLALGAAGAAVSSGFFIRAALQVLDDTLQHSLQKPVEQVSLLPFPGPVKSATVATLGGVFRPLSKAAGGLLAILFVSQGRLLALLTVASALGALVIAFRHRALYLSALEGALTRHSVDFGDEETGPLVVDREALSVIDRGLEDEDATVVVFSLSLLEGLPTEDALPRAERMLGHPMAEVRAEAASVIGRLDLGVPAEGRRLLVERLEGERSPFVLSSMLDALGALVEEGDRDPALFVPYLDHADVRVRRHALTAMGWHGDPEIETRTRALLRSDDSEDRIVGAGAAGDLGLGRLVGDLGWVVEDDRARPAALEALARLGAQAVPVLSGLLERRALPLSIRRSVVTALAGIGHPMARDALLSLVDEPALGPPALTSLRRLRSDGVLDAVDAAALRPLLVEEVRRGFRYGLVATMLHGGRPDEETAFVAAELDGLRVRSLHRAFRILALAYDPTRLESVHRALLTGDALERSNALELLEGVLSREDATRVIPLAEVGPEGVGMDAAAEALGDVDEVRRRPLESLLDDPDWWPRSLALHALGRAEEITLPGRDPDANDEDDSMIPLIERVMILKGSQLFRFFPGSDLAGIASLAEVVHLQEDEVVFRQGDVGDAFYMVVQGGIRISRGQVELAVLGAREGFGEMAVLDQETRSATATAAEATTLLRIDKDSFDRLIEQNPSVARGIYRMLTQRLRNTLAQVAAG